MVKRTQWWLSTGPGLPSEPRAEPGAGGLWLRISEWSPSLGVAEEPRPPVVVLHGFLEQGAAWEAVATQLGRRVVAPDQRGHGRSGHVGSGGFYHFWDYVADLDALVEHLGAPVDLVGHSMGGTVASLYAGARPECVRRLVLVEGLGPPDVTASAVDRARRFLADRRRGPRHRPMADRAEGVERVRAYNPNIGVDVAERLVARVTRRSSSGWVWTWDALHRARSPVPFQAALFRRFLSNVTAPTLVVRGLDSGFVLDDEEERFACLAHATRADLPGAGHLVHHDVPDALSACIREHLA